MIVRMVSAWAVVMGTVALLAGCGDSYPLPAADSSNASYVPAEGEFAVAGPVGPGTAATNNCNLDTVDGAPAGSKPLARGGTALFAGWAGSGDGTAVPATVELVLLGATDFQVRVPTGAPRPDVAVATHHPELGKSGYAINADLSAIPAGSYKVELRYKAGGKALRCATPRPVTVR